MPDDIERIVDRKLIKQRVHYYVVWKGFGQENNTWESRIDLMADGYSDIIKRFEDQRRRRQGARHLAVAAPAARRQEQEPWSFQGTSQSLSQFLGEPQSLSQRLGEPEEGEEAQGEPSKTPTTPQRRRSPRYKENNNETNVKETPRRRSTRKQATPETSSTQFVSPLAPQVREMTPPAPLTAETEVHKKPVTLSYEEEEDSVLLKSQTTKKAESSATVHHEHASSTQNGLIAKAVESGYLASFLSVAAVVGSLVASQMLPRDADEETDLWRRWLSFLTPVVALLLFFHQKDARASASGWPLLLLLISDTPREFEMMVAISVALANVSLLIAVVSILRNGEHDQSKSTLALLSVGVLTLFLSDSWVISTENSELESRVILMSMAVVSIPSHC
ncbi:Chromo domain [Phytophthora cactorum]|nr:Chromo domain [Phytophthora cactorum]